ncbi:MAG: RNA polymerase sigma factor [Bacteroidia bacterium]|nr:RNA polymerase sigma factor [Bacteroidia bacterium]
MNKSKFLNPFKQGYDAKIDIELIRRSLSGDKDSLNTLLKIHQAFIYNLALKMINNVADAEDVTQEILIKIITNLVSYDEQKAKFTTWVYRIIVNHILNLKKQKYETLVDSFEIFFAGIEQTATIELSQEEETSMTKEIEEGKIACMSGMLMCLDREQRLTYILGALFEIDHHLGAEIFDISPDNFRQRLSRAKKDLHQWMHNRCGLVNAENPCRCPKKTKGFIQNGWLDPNKLKWNADFVHKIKDYAAENINETLLTYDQLYARLYQDHPFKIPKNADGIVDFIINNDNLRKSLKY